MPKHSLRVDLLDPVSKSIGIHGWHHMDPAAVKDCVYQEKPAMRYEWWVAHAPALPQECLPAARCCREFRGTIAHGQGSPLSETLCCLMCA